MKTKMILNSIGKTFDLLIRKNEKTNCKKMNKKTVKKE